MKLYQIVFALLSSISIHAAAQTGGIQFFQGTWEEALAKAKQEHKILFVDAYAVWCGPCQRMAQDVFPKPEVGAFYNKHFINVKMDCEKGDGVGFAQKYKVGSYPTLLFIDADGKVVNESKGARPADQFLTLGKATLNRGDKTADYADEYENGNRKPDFLRSYAYQLLTQSKPSVKIANEYIRTQTDLQTPANLEFIFDFCTESDSRIFQLCIDHKDALIKEQTADVFRRKMEQACNATIFKAVELNIPSLHEEAKANMKKAVPSYAKEYALLADIQYYTATKDIDKLQKAADGYYKKFAKKDAAKLSEQALNLARSSEHKEVLNIAERWAKEAMKLDSKDDYKKNCIEILQRNGKTQEAIQLMKKDELPVKNMKD